MGPVSEFTVENVALPSFDLHWYRSTTNQQTDLSKIPVISYSSKTRPYRELMSELSRRIGPKAARLCLCLTVGESEDDCGGNRRWSLPTCLGQ